VHSGRDPQARSWQWLPWSAAVGPWRYCCWWAWPVLADLPDAVPPRDFLSRPALSGYVNYGEEVYRPYRREIRLQQRYDYLGNYLTRGSWSTGWTSSGPLEPGAQGPALSLAEQPGHRQRLVRAVELGADGRGRGAHPVHPVDPQAGRVQRAALDLVFPGNQLTVLVTRGFDSSLSHAQLLL